MPEKEQNSHKDFMIETIKQRPINRKKLLRRTILTAAMAVMFGLVACVTFLVLEPVISNWLQPEEGPNIVVFPEDQQEMLPEEMLAENQGSGGNTLNGGLGLSDMDEEKLREVLSKMIFDENSCRQLYSAMSDYVEELNQYTVTVTAVSSRVDWFNNVQENKNQSSGMILTDNGKELLILTYATPLRSAKSYSLTFNNKVTVNATVKQVDNYTNLAVMAVDFKELPDDMQRGNIKYPSLNFYSGKSMPGTPVVAVGSPMGIRNSIGYGVITAADAQHSVSDRNLRIIQTDIVGSKNAGGVLFNLEGQVVGIITGNRAGYDVENVIYAYSIQDLKKTLERLSNGKSIPYLGIMGINVTNEISIEFGVPMGGFVTKVDMDSPAMRAGIQQGDVIVGIGDKDISSFNEYTNVLMQLEPGRNIEIRIKRQAQDGYKDMTFDMETGETKK